MHSVAVRMQLAHTPLGARVAAAAMARGRVEDARSDHGAQSRLPHRLAPEAPSSVVWACEAAGEAAGEAGHRRRDQGIGIGRSPARGSAKLSIGLDFGSFKTECLCFHRIDRQSEICGAVPICTIRARRRAAHLAMHISISQNRETDKAGGS